MGTRPPGCTNNYDNMWLYLKNICRAHVALYNWLHKTEKHPEFLSMAENLAIFKPKYSFNIIDPILVTQAHKFYNKTIFNALCTGTLKFEVPFGKCYETKLSNAKSLDYLAINHYNRVIIGIDVFSKLFISYNLGKTSNERENTLGWAIVPNSLYLVLKDNVSFNLPMMITEHGTCDVGDLNDELRQNTLFNAFACIQKALQKKFNVIGYMHWSLMDNFEWEFGRDKKFGLFKTHYDKLDKEERLEPRESAKIYQQILSNFSTRKLNLKYRQLNNDLFNFYSLSNNYRSKRCEDEIHATIKPSKKVSFAIEQIPEGYR